MKQFFFIRYLILFYSIVSPIYGKQPMFFNPYTQEIYKSTSNIKTPCAIACPAQKDPEKIMDRLESLNNKAIFVREFYNINEMINKDITCEHSFKMAAVYDHKNKTIEFGYEIYFYDSRLPKDVKRSVFSRYDTVKAANRIPTVRPRYPTLLFVKPLSFIWIPKIIIQYYNGSWILHHAKYTTHRDATRLNVKCHNHHLGGEFFNINAESFDRFYSDENQKRIFSIVKLPELPEDSICKLTKVCVKKYNLLLPYHFQASYQSSVACSNLTTIPIWYEIVEKLLDYLEKFLIAIGEITNNKLNISSGSQYGSYFPSIDEKKSNESKFVDMHLYPKKKKIAIPRIIYKIVSYESYDCDSKEMLCWYFVVIVIHNEPEFAEDDKLCKEDKCQEWGWESIQYSSPFDRVENKSKHIYCCSFSQDIQEKLQLSKDGRRGEDLKLNQFPYYDENIHETKYENKQKQFEEKVNEIMQQV